MKTYITKSTKSEQVQKTINEALDILESVGIPVTTKSERGLERMAVCFLAVAGVSQDWTQASNKSQVKTREIIAFVNKYFEETISPGSYDDIRRKDLKLLVLADLIVNNGNKQSAATNDPTRGYALHTDFKELVVNYGTVAWDRILEAFNKNKPSLAELLARKRDIEKIPVTLPDGKPLQLSLGEHNVLQKEIIEQFLPRFGSDCDVLYVGDTSNKMLHIDEAALTGLNFFKLSHDELPDIIAFSKTNNWLYLIEAVHSSGPMSEIRVHELKKLLKDCKAELIFVTAFLTRADFRKWTMDIAWETEAWIADNPDHLIHFNGHKFLGAYCYRASTTPKTMIKPLITLFLLTLILSTQAQQPKTLTKADYDKAQRFVGSNAEQLVDHGSVRPNWLPNDQFWYRDLTATGSQLIQIDPAKKTRTVISSPPQSASMSSGVESGRRPRGESGLEVLSPDGKKAAYIKDYNLWVRDVPTGKQTQLTTDGINDFGYATDNAGWKHSDRAILAWSPDSKKIATFQQDQRKVSDMYLVTTNVGKPKLEQWKYPLPGDSVIATIQRVIINVDSPKVIRLQIPADPHRATLSDDIASSGTFDDVYWNDDATKLAFVSTSRDHKQEKMRIADATTGAVREVFEETVPTQYESGWGGINWRFLDKSNEIIWFSERNGWGHLYLYDAKSGKLKNQITKGDYVVTKLLKVDEKNRMLYFMANGREPVNPYFSQFCRIGFDGKNFAVLTPDIGNHQVTISPSGNYFIDSYSQPNVPATIALRSMDGKLVMDLEKTDISRLTATGWQPPTPITVKAQDGKTDIYGLLYKPTNLDPNKKYPVVDYIYPGPQGGSVGNWSFGATRKDNQALAELGFIVVEIEGTSNPLRSKSFHDMSYGNMAENTLPDQITGIRQLAQKYPYMDTSRVGIWGHSGGGFATATAMFRFPDFFKVGIAESGNHENRNYEDDWGERYNGLTSASDYEAQANQNYAKNLKGKLLLAHGMMDDNVPPSNTMLVVEALEKANKDFDLVLFPNARHGFGSLSNYMMRRRWDYFVKNLAGNVPPKEYLIELKPDPRYK